MNEFTFDVFLSHSSKDEAVALAIAGRLRTDGLRVWFDQRKIHTTFRAAARIEERLERSRVLVLCMSANAFGEEWALLESQIFRFRDPLNHERHFIPLRLDEAPIMGSLAQLPYISWLPEDRELEYPKLLEACRPPALKEKTAAERATEKAIKLDYDKAQVLAYAFSPDGKRVLTGSSDKTGRLWDMEGGRCLRVFEGHEQPVWSVAWSADKRRALTGGDDKTLRCWDVESGNCIRVMEDHSGGVMTLGFSADQKHALSGSQDNTMRLWDLESGRCLKVLEGHTSAVWCVAWGAHQHRAISGSVDKTMRVWDLESGRCLRVFEGHTEPIWSVAWSADQLRAISGSVDRTVRVWDLESGRCLRVLEGHTQSIRVVAWNANQRHVISGSDDNTVRLWDLETGLCLRVLECRAAVWGVAWDADERHAFSGEISCGISVWDLSEFITDARGSAVLSPGVPSPEDQVHYTNAKVILVGDTGAGKTGLSMRLALRNWEPSDSTVGAWATRWHLPLSSREGIQREIWLWDFGGQADQRLIHQLYMEDTALAVLVFDGQKDDVFEVLGQWDMALTRAWRRTSTKLLVAGRLDAGGLRASRSQIEEFVKERGYACFIETSAKFGTNCEELREAILAGIRWADIPWRSSPILFKRLKDEIVQLKDEGRILMRFNELRDALRLRCAGDNLLFGDEDLRAVVGLLAGPGIVWELKFGSWVLLQPERINAYAQAVIQTLRADPYERGCIPEEQVLMGNLTYHFSMERLGDEEERFVLLAMHQTLIERGLCLREHTDQGPLLVFPTYYRRERPELVGHPAVVVSYWFNGFLDDVYATLVVRLHHTEPFHQDQLWRYAADFRTLTGKQLGVKMTRRAEGAGELAVYFDSAIPIEEKIIFSRYVHEHLFEKTHNVVRLRHYVCQHCGTPVGNREVAMKRLEDGKEDIVCVNCEKRIPLWDEMEDLFGSASTKERVRLLQQQSAIVLDNESKERALVGEVISTVALAGQICREFNVSDHGIDLEIEFKSDRGEATGHKLYVQLKSGDSYLRRRTRKKIEALTIEDRIEAFVDEDELEVFTIRKQRHAGYWMSQAFPVMLVIRASNGETQWMEVRDWLKRASDNGTKPVKEIFFEGERFDVTSVRRWRDRALGQSPTSGAV